METPSVTTYPPDRLRRLPRRRHHAAPHAYSDCRRPTHVLATSIPSCPLCRVASKVGPTPQRHRRCPVATSQVPIRGVGSRDSTLPLFEIHTRIARQLAPLANPSISRQSSTPRARKVVSPTSPDSSSPGNGQRPPIRRLESRRYHDDAHTLGCKDASGDHRVLPRLTPIPLQA